MSETRWINRIFFLWDYEEEQCWLDEMAAEGWALKEVRLCRYLFEKCEPGEWSVQFEMRESRPGSKENHEYISFIESTGAEYIGAVKRWVYFRKRTAEGEFTLYSDMTSRLDHINRIIALAGTLCLPLTFMLGYMAVLWMQGVAQHWPISDFVSILLCSVLLGAELLWLLRGWFKLRGIREKLKQESCLRE